MKVKAIETRYAGCRFRSRLEARWAVFFDALGVKWEYESEGYDLGGGLGLYLPDFWVPDLSTIFEIKPISMAPMLDGCRMVAHPDCTITVDLTFAERKLAALAAAGVAEETAIIYGSPWPGAYECMIFRWDGAASDLPDDLWCKFWTDDLNLSSRVYRAFSAARSARFEHGETGRIAA